MDTNDNNTLETTQEQTVETTATEQNTVETPAAEQPVEQKPAEVQTLGPDAIQILTEMRDMTRKDLILRRINTGAILFVCVAMLVVLIGIVPRVFAAIDSVNEVVTSANKSLEEIDSMVAEMSEASSNINKLVKDNAEPLSEAVHSMSNVDFDGLNKAIEDLQTTVGPMASFFGRFQ